MQCIEDISNQDKSEFETEENVSASLNCEATKESDKNNDVSNLALYFENSKSLLFDNVFKDKKSVEDYLDGVIDSNEKKAEPKYLSLPEIQLNDEVIDSKNIYASNKIYVPKIKNTDERKEKISLLSKCSDQIMAESLNQTVLLDKSMPIDLNYDVPNASCTLENEISYEPFAIGYTGLNPLRKSIASSLQELSQNLNHETSLSSTNHHTAKNSSKKLNIFKSQLKIGRLPKTLTKSLKSTTSSLKEKNKTSKVESLSIANHNLCNKNITSEEFEESNWNDSVYKGNQQLHKASKNKAKVKLKYSGNNETKRGKQLKVVLTDFFPDKTKKDYINLFKHSTSSVLDSAIDCKNPVKLSNLKDKINDNTTPHNSKKTKNKKQTKMSCNSVFNKDMLDKEKDSNQPTCLSNPIISKVQQISLKEFNATLNQENSSVGKTSLLGHKVINTNAKKKVTSVKNGAISKSFISVDGINGVNKSEKLRKNHKVEKSKPMTTTPLSKQSPFMQLVNKFVDDKHENSQIKVFPARQDFIEILSNSSKNSLNDSQKEKNCNDQVTPSSKRGRKRQMDKLSTTVDPCCSKSLHLKNTQVQNSKSVDKHNITNFISTAEIHVPPKSSIISGSSLSPFKTSRRISQDASQNSLKSILDEHLLPISLPFQSLSNGKNITLNSAINENNVKEKDDMNSSESSENDISCSRESKSEKKSNMLNKNTKCNSTRMAIKSSKSQFNVTNNTSVNRLESFQQTRDEMCFKSPVKKSNLLSHDASSMKNILSGIDIFVKSDLKDNLATSSHGVSLTKHENAINRKAMSDADDTLNAFDTESFEDNIPLTKVQSKQERKKKLVAKNQLAGESVSHSSVDAEPLFSNIPEPFEDNIPPTKGTKRRMKKKLVAGNQMANFQPETPVLHAPFSHRLRGKKRLMETELAKNYSSNADVVASESPKDIPLVQEKSKRGRKKKLPTANQFPETSILDSSCSQLSSAKSKCLESELKTDMKFQKRFTNSLPISTSDKLLGSPEHKRRKTKEENSSNVSNSTKSLTNSYKTAGKEKSKQEKNTVINTTGKCIKIKDIINSPKDNVVNSKNNSYYKNKYSQSKSIKDLPQNNAGSRSNVSIKKFQNGGCDLKGTVEIKKEGSSSHGKAHHNSVVFSDSSEIEDFFVDSDNAWPTQIAGNDDMKPKSSKISARQKTKPLKMTHFLKANDSSKSPRKASKDNYTKSPRKSDRVKKRTARYSLDAFFSPDEKNTKVDSLSSAKKNIKIEPSLLENNENKLNFSNANQSFDSVSLNGQTSSVATINGISCFPNQNPIKNNAASNNCMSYAVPAYVFPSSNTLVISLPPSFSFNCNQVNSSNQFVSPFQVPQVPYIHNPSNIITQFSSSATPHNVSYPLYQNTTLSQSPNIQSNNLFSSNITPQTVSRNVTDTMVVNSDIVSKSQFFSPSNFSVAQSTPVMNVQNMNSYSNSKLNKMPTKRIVKNVVNNVVAESTAVKKTVSHSVNSHKKQNSISTLSEAHQNQPSKHVAAQDDKNKKELCLLNYKQNEDAVIKDIVNGLVLWDEVMHNLTGFTCMQRMTEFTATVFSACEFDEFVKVREYFSNNENLNMLNSKIITHSFEIPCQGMYKFPELLLDAPMRQILKHYVSYHVKQLLNVTNHKELIEQVYQKFPLQDCFYLSAILPKREIKKEMSLKILVEYFTFVAVFRIYDEYKKRMEIH